jgi:beta-galactosidase
MPGATRPAVAYDVGDPYVTAFCHDLMRGLKDGRPYWVMEQQAGHINWADVNPAIQPGTVRLWTWHELAAGADTVVYFRWRACLYAQEQYHSGLLRHDAGADLGYREVLSMRDEAQAMAALQGARVQTEVALLVDFENLWATDLQPHNRSLTYWRHLFAYHRALLKAGACVNLVSTRADLSPYRLVLAPSLLIADEALAARLAAYLEAGGTLLLGARSGFKTPTNLATDEPLPGPLRGLVGATVEAWHSLPAGITYGLRGSTGGTSRAGNWAEALAAEAAEAVMVYADGPLAGAAGVTANRLGKGRIFYAGVWPDESVADELLRQILPDAGVKPLALLPEGVLVYHRGSYLVLLNFTDAASTAWVAAVGDTTVAARDVRVLPAR